MNPDFKNKHDEILEVNHNGNYSRYLFLSWRYSQEITINSNHDENYAIIRIPT